MIGFDFDFSEFQAFADQFQAQLNQEAMLIDAFNQLGNLMIRNVKNNTPVGQYDNTVYFVRGGKLLVFESDRGSGRTGGNLRRNWNLDGVSKSGGGWVIKISNNTEYASWVESGHRKADHSGWVEGQFFMKITMEQMLDALPAIIGPDWEAYLRGFGLS